MRNEPNYALWKDDSTGLYCLIGSALAGRAIEENEKTMNVPEEIELHAANGDKPILRWLFSRYHWQSEWRFVATCKFKRWGRYSYQSHRVWEPTEEGRILYEGCAGK